MNSHSYPIEVYAYVSAFAGTAVRIYFSGDHIEEHERWQVLAADLRLAAYACVTVAESGRAARPSGAAS